jgi:hypothetical protein
MIVETRITRDVRIPAADDDREMESGWRCVPVPPTDDPSWQIDPDYASDRKTRWRRVHIVWGSA